MRTPAEYDSYLNEQDTHVVVLDGHIVCTFDRQYKVPLYYCNTVESAIFQADRFAHYLVAYEPKANHRHLPHRFLSLVKYHCCLDIDPLAINKERQLAFLGQASSLSAPKNSAKKMTAALVSSEGDSILELSWDTFGRPFKKFKTSISRITKLKSTSLFRRESGCPPFRLLAKVNELRFISFGDVLILQLEKPLSWSSSRPLENSALIRVSKPIRFAIRHSFSVKEFQDFLQALSDCGIPSFCTLTLLDEEV